MLPGTVWAAFSLYSVIASTEQSKSLVTTVPLHAGTENKTKLYVRKEY